MGQSSAVRTFLICLLAGVAAFGVLLTLLPENWMLALCVGLIGAYLPSFLDGSERTAEGRFWQWYAEHPIWRRVLKTPYIVTCEEELDKTKQYIFCSHPHGVMSIHHGCMMAGVGSPSFHDVYPAEKRRDLGASVVFKIPFYREFLLWFGCVDASRAVAHKVLNSGRSLVILVGGEAEQLLSQRGDQTVVIKHRKGFVKLALAHGASIVPCYCFGETDLYSQSTLLFQLRKKIQKTFGAALVLAWGRNILLPWLPYDDVKLHHVYGKPIEVPKVEHPTHEQVDAIHQQYMRELQRIFDAHKTKFGYGDKQLMML